MPGKRGRAFLELSFIKCKSARLLFTGVPDGDFGKPSEEQLGERERFIFCAHLFVSVVASGLMAGELVGSSEVCTMAGGFFRRCE